MNGLGSREPRTPKAGAQTGKYYQKSGAFGNGSGLLNLHDI
jgi:hypothetical protein